MPWPMIAMIASRKRRWGNVRSRMTALRRLQPSGVRKFRTFPDDLANRLSRPFAGLAPATPIGKMTWLGVKQWAEDRRAHAGGIARQEIAAEHVVVLAEEHALAPGAALTRRGGKGQEGPIGRSLSDLVGKCYYNGNIVVSTCFDGQLEKACHDANWLLTARESFAHSFDADQITEPVAA
jgi:hypothetical protein